MTTATTTLRERLVEAGFAEIKDLALLELEGSQLFRKPEEATRAELGTGARVKVMGISSLLVAVDEEGRTFMKAATHCTVNESNEFMKGLGLIICNGNRFEELGRQVLEGAQPWQIFQLFAKTSVA